MILRHMESVIILRYSKAVLRCLSFCPDANVDPSHEADQPLFQPGLSPTVSGRRFSFAAPGGFARQCRSSL